MGHWKWCKNTLLKIKIGLFIQPEIFFSNDGIFDTF